MLEKMGQNSFGNVKDCLLFFCDDMDSAKKEYRDKESRLFFESLKNKFTDRIPKLLSDVQLKIEDEDAPLEDIKDTEGYKELRSFCVDLILFLMMKKRTCKNVGGRLHAAFQFLCTHLENK